MNPNNLGKTIIVDECQQISINTFIRRAKIQLKKTLISSQIEMSGVSIHLAISVTGNGGLRFWFECPLCKKRVGVLYTHPLNQNVGCRKCLGLEYRNQRYKGMVEDCL